MKRAMMLLASFACCSGIGCDTQSTAKLILTVGLNAHVTPNVDANATVIATSDRPQPRARRTSPIDGLVAEMQELDALCNPANPPDAELATRLTDLIDRLTESVASFENRAPGSTVLDQQAREAQAVALVRAAESLPAEFAGRRDACCQATFGRAWDRDTVEKQAINRLVSSYLVAPKVPADVAQVLALHSVTFPLNSMNVELYTTMVERLTGEGKLLDGVELARAGLRFCALHTDVNRLQKRVKQVYREHPGEIGVPMNFAGPTLRERRFILNSLQGSPVLVVFWSPSEPVASEFMDSCLSLSSRYSEAELEVVGVNLGANLKDAELWLVERGFSCRQVFSVEKGHAGLENPIARFYGVTVLPAFFLLDRDGIVIARGADELGVIESELRQLSTPRLALSDDESDEIPATLTPNAL